MNKQIEFDHIRKLAYDKGYQDRLLGLNYNPYFEEPYILIYPPIDYGKQPFLRLLQIYWKRGWKHADLECLVDNH